MSTSFSKMNYPKMLRAKEVATMLNCSAPHVYNLVKEGILQRVAIGKRAYAYDPIDIVLFSIRGYC